MFRTQYLVLLAVLAATGCAPSAAEYLQGRWEGRLESMSVPRQAGPTVGAEPVIAEPPIDMLRELNFRKDGTVVAGDPLSIFDTQREAAWSVVKEGDDTVTVELRYDHRLLRREVARRLELEMEGMNRFRLSPRPGAVYLYERTSH